MASREHSLIHPIWQGREEEFLPLCNQKESDSANLDHMAEFVVRSGTDAQQALMALVPEAYRNHPDLMANYPQVQLLGELPDSWAASCNHLQELPSRQWQSHVVG